MKSIICQKKSILYQCLHELQPSLLPHCRFFCNPESLGKKSQGEPSTKDWLESRRADIDRSTWNRVPSLYRSVRYRHGKTMDIPWKQAPSRRGPRLTRHFRHDEDRSKTSKNPLFLTTWPTFFFSTTQKSLFLQVYPSHSKCQNKVPPKTELTLSRGDFSDLAHGLLGVPTTFTCV